MLLIGRLGPNNTFQPQHAMIVRNKDELTIPLLLETLPSAAEFRDAIASLSPEQQRFCTAYRSMQLEGTVFGLLVLQLKPQLERLLRLPPDTLVKETALTEALLELFIDYQIPSDLLSFDGDLHASAAAKLAAVKAHVAAIKATIDEAKKAEVAAEKQAFEYAHPRPTHSDEEFESEYAQRGMPDSSMSHDMPVCRAAPRMACASRGLFGGAPPPPAAMEFTSIKGAPPRPVAMKCCMSMPPPSAPGIFGGGACAFGAAPSACFGAAPPAAGGMSGNAGGCFGAKSLGAPPPRANLLSYDSASCDSAASVPFSSSSSFQGTSSEEAKLQPKETPLAPEAGGGADGAEGGAVDFTKVPAELDARFEKHDVDGALRATTVKVGPIWQKRSQKALLAKPTNSTLGEAEQKSGKAAAFDLLDGLSRSGTLPIECATLHVVLCTTHCFDDSLIDTVVLRNANPIEKLERSSLIIGETILGTPAAQLLRHEEVERVAKFSAPMLLK